jgi:hypothetical protein
MIKAPIPDEIESEDSLHDEALGEDSGAYRLWLRITLLCVLDFFKYGARSGHAMEFIFDKNNIFFNFVCDQLGIDPERSRRKIKEVVDKKK